MPARPIQAATVLSVRAAAVVLAMQAKITIGQIRFTFPKLAVTGSNLSQGVKNRMPKVKTTLSSKGVIVKGFSQNNAENQQIHYRKK